MSTPPSAGDGASTPKVRRVDTRLGLAIDRASLSDRTLATYARDHVSVRTPSRPDFRDGNTLDLVGVPEPDQLPRWAERFAETIGILGVRHLQLRWETPLPPDAPAVAPDPDPDLRAAVTGLGAHLEAVTVLLLDELAAPPTTDAELIRLAPPRTAQEPTSPVERRWHATEVLSRYEHGDTPDDWRAADHGFAAWAAEIRRELARAGRAEVWLAQRQATPAARLALVHDRQGLAVVQDVVTHPVHRRRGLASALTHVAVTSHLAGDPSARIGIAALPGSSAERLYRQLGFRPHATVWTALRPAAVGGPAEVPR